MSYRRMSTTRQQQPLTGLLLKRYECSTHVCIQTCIKLSYSWITGYLCIYVSRMSTKDARNAILICNRKTTKYLEVSLLEVSPVAILTRIDSTFLSWQHLTGTITSPLLPTQRQNFIPSHRTFEVTIDVAQILRLNIDPTTLATKSGSSNMQPSGGAPHIAIGYLLANGTDLYLFRLLYSDQENHLQMENRKQHLARSGRQMGVRAFRNRSTCCTFALCYSEELFL